MYHCLQAGHFSFKTLLYKSKTYAAYLKNAQKNAAVCTAAFSQVEGEGFEPSKAEPTDLQSVPFSHSGIPPRCRSKAGDGTRTRNLLITNQLLCQLSYTSTSHW